MLVDELARRQAVPLGGGLQVDAEFAAVHHGHFPAPPGLRHRVQPGNERAYAAFERLVVERQRIELHHQRAVGRYGLDEPGRPLPIQDGVERQHTCTQCGIDLGPELHRHRAVAARQEADDRVVCAHVGRLGSRKAAKRMPR